EDGSLAPKDSLGRLRKVPIDEEDASGRTNYQKADYRNYEDGDLSSRINYDSDEGEGEGESSTREMYTDETSLVSDRARVYKGGSWKDRAYWLNPSNRRFMDERRATNDIGFRCAMTHVGSPGGME
ncbi:MAG: gliding motility lipoprotein GldJ, partial [Bacteroidales bacterium]